jgi:murein DD-endopeptidase MepM/ murein hydrolase activator NlpD
MIGSFRVRLLAVIIISALVGYLMQTSSSRATVEPVIRYIMGTDYNVEQVVADLLADIKDYYQNRTVEPVTSQEVFQIPCDYIGIDRSYGWFFNLKKNKQEFYPGISLRVEDNSLVRPVMPGTVEKITVDGEKRSVLITHNNGQHSLYEGFKEVLVSENDQVVLDSVLGKSGQTLYFELRDEEGPTDPQFIFR